MFLFIITNLFVTIIDQQRLSVKAEPVTRDLKSEYQPSNALIEHFATLERDRLNHVGGQDVAIKLEPQQDRRPPSTLPLMTHIGVLIYVMETPKTWL